jgi:thiol-disulfide isomerase/thioredoxin
MLAISRFMVRVVVCIALVLIACQFGAAQAAKAKTSPVVGPKVTQIDIEGLKIIVKPNGKPLLINFWATWCDPCREEFPDLVRLHTAYRGKVDFVSVSLDDLADIAGDVPKFLAQMKSEIPAYLLHTPDEEAAINLVSNDWSGNLPMTILLTPDGNKAYVKNGKIRLDAVTLEINKMLAPPQAMVSPKIELQHIISVGQTVDLPLPPSRTYTFEQGVAAAQTDISAATYKLLSYGLTPFIPKEQTDNLKKKYGVTVEGSGCMVPEDYGKYVAGYNSTTKKALQGKFGVGILPKIAFVPTDVPVQIQ